MTTHKYTKFIYASIALVTVCLLHSSEAAELFSSSNKVAVNNPPAPYSFAPIIEPLLPGTVNISTTTEITRDKMDEMMPFPQGHPFENFLKPFLDAIPEKQTVSSLGSGFIIDENGYIVTNNHVIAEATEIKVTLYDESVHKAEVVGRDPRTDIALLKIKTDKKLTTLKWGDSDKARVGDWVLVVGNPFGLGGTVTSGIISSLSRPFRGQADYLDNVIQTEAAINRGHSGGAMINLAGEVVGVNMAIVSNTGSHIGIGFAIPANVAKQVVTQLKQHGKTRRGWLGILIQEVEDLAEGFGLDKPKGALINRVLPEGPAAKAGLKDGDIIIEVGNTPIKDSRHLMHVVGETNVGSTLDIVVWRNKEKVKLSTTIREFEEAEKNGLLLRGDKRKALDPQKAAEGFGLKLQALTPELRETFRLAADAEGVLVVDVSREATKFERGDLITAISNESVKTPKEVFDKLEAAKKAGIKVVICTIKRNGGSSIFSSINLEDDKKSDKTKETEKNQVP